MKLKPLIFFLNILGFFLSASSLSAQVTLSGKVLNQQQQPVPNVNILVYPHGSPALIAFGFSKADGSFQVKVNSASDSLLVEITSIQHQKYSRIVANTSQELDFRLQPQTKDLHEFVMRAAPIEQRGDTISYLVSSFARENDRSIADVLKKMPGIEIEPSGRILYQGDPIQHFYVEGLDLMGGRYGLVSNNLPHRSVASVQILENHQPVKILEDRIASHQASLNIKLKREITTTGTATLGSGLNPLLWDANITPMTFTRNFQLAGSYQTNNTGKDAARQLTTLTPEGLRNQMQSEIHRRGMISVPALAPPDFNENRHLDNNIHLVNTNSLLRLARDLQLRTNLWYIYDQQQQQGNSRRTLYTPADTLQFDDRIHNQIRKNYFRGEFTLNRNTKNNYLNNKLEFNLDHDKHQGSLQYLATEPNSVGMQQHLSTPFRNVSNSLSMIKPIGSRLVEFNSQLQYSQTPQQLEVQPAVFASIIFPDHTISEVYQSLQQQRLNSNHAASLSWRIKRWTLSPRLGIQHQRYSLQSELEGKDASDTFRATGLFSNHLEGIRTQTYLNTELSYRKNALNVSINLPLSYVDLQLQDSPLQQKEHIKKILFDPRIMADYQISGFWRIRGSYGFRQTMESLEGMHYGYLLRNHRQLQIQEPLMEQGYRHTFSAFLGYRNPINSFFSSLNYTYSISQNQQLLSTNILNDGSLVITNMAIPNQSSMHQVNSRVSKYFMSLRSTFALNTNYTRNERPQWINNSLNESLNNIYSIVPGCQVRFTQWLSSDYKATWMYYDTWRNHQKLNDLSLMRHNLDVVIIPARHQFITLKGEYYHFRQKQDYFLDLHYRYTLAKRKIDIDLHWINIFNHARYRDVQVGAYSLVENSYALRPMQLMASVKFSF